MSLGRGSEFAFTVLSTCVDENMPSLRIQPSYWLRSPFSILKIVSYFTLVNSFLLEAMLCLTLHRFRRRIKEALSGGGDNSWLGVWSAT